MSYILDALKKSENERQSQDLPDLNAIHERPQLQPVKKQKMWPIILIIIIILNVGGGWFVWQRTPLQNTTAIPTMARTTIPSTSAVFAGSASKAHIKSESVAQQQGTDIIVTPLGVQERAQNNPRLVQKAEAANVALNPTNEILITPQDVYRRSPTDSGTLNQELRTERLNWDQPVKKITALPTNIQRQIPDLRFSSHLYADDNRFRMVNINGNMFQEGDYIAEGIRLERISEEGVVLNYLHYTFEISVIRDWSFR